MKTTHAKRTEMSDFETAKYRMKQGFKELGLVALIGIASIVVFAVIAWLISLKVSRPLRAVAEGLDAVAVD